MSIYVELYNKSEVYKKKYPKGTRVQAIEINDKNAPPKGTKGTVSFVDDIGTVFVDWDEDGYVSGVVVANNVDTIRIIKEKNND